MLLLLFVIARMKKEMKGRMVEKLTSQGLLVRAAKGSMAAGSMGARV